MQNPIIKCDYPDPDVIRVNDTYYMLSTTMHYFPGGAILRSYDLINWELVNYLYDVLENTEAARLADSRGIYGQGMWAPCLRYHAGIFYVCFVANDVHKTYLFYTKEIEGSWKRQEIEGFYHDASLLFDENRVYIVYGNTEIYITELKPDLSGPLKGGFHRLLLKDTGKIRLGYEGTHIYHINGKYYLFFIHWPDTGSQRRTQACFVSDSLTGEFRGRDVLDDDMGFHNQGIAQGGIVDTPDGRWFSILFQDSGAAGRLPVLIPINFENDFPVFGEHGVAPKEIHLPSLRPKHFYESLFTSDFTDENGNLKLQWQWNHLPVPTLYELSSTTYTVRTDKLSTNIAQAVNTLTQRTRFPQTKVSVTLDASHLKDGDVAGLCAFQSSYAHLAVTSEDQQYFLILTERNVGEISQNMTDKDTLPGNETFRMSLDGPIISLCMTADFSDMKDEVQFSYQKDDSWRPVGSPHKLAFTLDHFTGCRAALFMYSTKTTGGSCTFSDFHYY